MPKCRLKIVACMLIVISVFLSGCGLFGDDNVSKEIDPPKDVTYTENEEELQPSSDMKEKDEGELSKEGEDAQTTKRVLYLIDKNGMVVPQTVELPATKEVAKQVLEYLVIDGPVSNVLPNGFRAVLPQGTVVQGVNIKEDGTAIVDFSKEFTEYQPEDEKRILQAVTWTLTQFDSIKKVKFWINGHELQEMPVNGTPISVEGVSREDGINMISTSVVDITNTKPLTVYYLAEEDGQVYYVPVTKRISNSEKDMVKAAVNALIEGPDMATGLLSDFQPEVELLENPIYKDNQVTLNFNKAIYSSIDEESKMISEHVLNALVLTVTEQPGIESVVIQVDGKQDLVDENGNKLTEPVSRPEIVDTGSF